MFTEMRYSRPPTLPLPLPRSFPPGPQTNHSHTPHRAALNIPKTTDILDHIYSLPSTAEQEDAMAAIRAIEGAAMLEQKPQVGLVQLMRYLEGRGVRKGICTRNFE